MGFRSGAKATVWEVRDGFQPNTKSVKITIRRKNKDGEWVNDFKGFCTFINSAAQKAENLKEKDHIVLKGCDVSNWWNKEKEKEYITFKVFDFEISEQQNNTATNDNYSESNTFEGDIDDDDLPL